MFTSAIAIFLFLYLNLFTPNIILKKEASIYLNIPTGSNRDEVVCIFQNKGILKSTSSFTRVAKWKKYDKRIKAGRYRITDGMSNNRLVNLLRSGKQDPVRVIFQNIRNKEEFSGKISCQIEADSLSIINLLNDNTYLAQFDVNSMNSLTLFIPNTYEFYWNTSSEMFIKRMVREHQRFWNTERITKCRATGLSWQQATILASIVEKETTKDKEKTIIAGVYLNRLRQGWPLQADPTIIFAWNDYSIKRVLQKHLQINSPYNTYINIGLPPGPICMPSIASIESVLNFKQHNYMYFCAKDDLSGYHVFARTLSEHNRNAKKYQYAIKKQIFIQ